jgi:hypothetical protein
MSIDVYMSFERETLTSIGGSYIKGFNTEQLKLLIEEKKDRSKRKLTQ